MPVIGGPFDGSLFVTRVAAPTGVQATDTAAIQSAINALPTAGGVVRLQAGLYALNTSIIIASLNNLSIVGEGNSATGIVVNGNYDAFTISGAWTHVKIASVWIGSFAARSAGWGINAQGSSGLYGDGLYLDDVTVQNTNGGIFEKYVANGRCRNVTVLASAVGAAVQPQWWKWACVSHRLLSCQIQTLVNTGSDGMRLDSDCDTIVCHGLEVVGHPGQRFGGSAIRLVNSVGGSSTGPRIVRLRDCFGEYATLDGLKIEDCRDAQVVGGSFANNSDIGINITGGNVVTVDSTTSVANATFGIAVQGGNDVSVARSNFTNNGTAATATYYGAYIGNGTSHVTFTGNHSGDFMFPAIPSQAYGLVIGTGTDYIIATGNDLTRNMTSSLVNNSTGTHNQIANNAT